MGQKRHFPVGFAVLLWNTTILITLAEQAAKPLPHTGLISKTRWDVEVSATNVLSEYPRPSMFRSAWLNLNGEWDFSLSPFGQANPPAFTNKILVPFPAESSLSGFKHPVNEQQSLWYHRTFSIPNAWQNQRILLHFEAADWKTTVWVNNHLVGTHEGGYDRFSFDITEALNSQKEQHLTVLVIDPTDSGYQPRGKQMLHPRPPFFSAASGIWQPVWLEPVPNTSIESLKLIPDIDANLLKITVFLRNPTDDVDVEASALDDGKTVGYVESISNKEFNLTIPTPKLWTPDNPFLYHLNVTLRHKGTEIDKVESYFGMRKISVAKDEHGFPQLMLNNKRSFQFGPLDQGYWPDGIYTAPTDEALRYDIEIMKQLGFNLCRKHVKIEPERWYYWCDKLGLLVWQDMPNCDAAASASEKEIQRKPVSAQLFEIDLQRMVLALENHPSIVMWIPFNQGWGQYDTVRITDMVKELDPSRLVAGVSGWNDMGGGDVRSLHQYPGPATPQHDGKRACVIGECGGLGLVIPKHIWGGITHWNTTYFETTNQLFEKYSELVASLKDIKDNDGLAAAVVTQWTDIEKEDNGFLTYDRDVIKMPLESVRKINEDLIQSQAVGPSAHQNQ